MVPPSPAATAPASEGARYLAPSEGCQVHRGGVTCRLVPACKVPGRLVAASRQSGHSMRPAKYLALTHDSRFGRTNSGTVATNGCLGRPLRYMPSGAIVEVTSRTM